MRQRTREHVGASAGSFTNNRQRYVRLATAVGTWLLVGCGGRVSPDPDPGPEDAANNGAASNGSASNARTSGSDQGDGTGLDPSQTLGECPKGWTPGDADCPWLASNDLCYATKVDACSCICPRSDKSLCLSGLPGGADSRTWVICD